MNDYELKQHIERKERKANMEAIVKQLSDAVNVMGREDEAAADFLEALTREHRTLQQGMMGIIFKTVHGYADARHDLRNEGAVNACKRINELLEGEEIHLPFI